ncbi:MAG: ATP-binding protein [Blastopirellula sp.]|nr:MAG: ATP-binding protein [Blastopirellula sp.]
MESLIRAEVLDNDLLLNVAHKIASLEKNRVRFSIDAGVISRLGQELVARQETAVSELVKNAYDADATRVTLTFVDTENIGGTLIIEDNGDGMTREELVKGFMRISSTNKIHEPVSREFKRKRAGQKGIGRFAVQRLGKKLSITTQVENIDIALKLDINWDDYQNDINLISISNQLSEYPKEKSAGTTLEISGLRDKWSEASIKRVYRYILNIIQPYSIDDIKTLKVQTNEKILENEENENIINHDPGFKSEFFKSIDGKVTVIADDSSMIFDHAAALIEGYIDENGQGLYSIQSERLSIDEVGEIGNDPDDKTVPFSLLKDIKFRAHYFLYAPAGIIPKSQEASIKKLARKEGGIRLYRNGFRVLPYAEQGDDWLRLDQSAGKRVILSPHSNNNFFGFVELKDLDNSFNETSSREGLIESEALIQLKNFVYRTLITGVIKVASTRKSKIVTSQKKDESGDWEHLLEVRIRNIALTLEELEQELDDQFATIETKRKRRRKVKKVQKEIEEVQEIQTKLLKERSMLRVLSSVGLTVAQFIHEIKYYMDSIQSDIRFVSKAVENDDESSKRMAILSTNFSTFQTYTSYFNDVVSQNVIRELSPINIKHIVNKFVDSIKSDATKVGIIFESPKFNKLRLITKPMHPSEWSSILFNFYTNSRKAIKRANTNGKILIECGENEDGIYLEFSDNGDGIEKNIEELIFEEFFTTTLPDNFDDLDSNAEILGTGLGLKIVKDIVKNYRGDIEVVSPKKDYSTCIRVVVQKASEKDLEDYDI